MEDYKVVPDEKFTAKHCIELEYRTGGLVPAEEFAKLAQRIDLLDEIKKLKNTKEYREKTRN
jgi:hypothetical protein